VKKNIDVKSKDIFYGESLLEHIQKLEECLSSQINTTMISVIDPNENEYNKIPLFAKFIWKIKNTFLEIRYRIYSAWEVLKGNYYED